MQHRSLMKGAKITGILISLVLMILLLFVLIGASVHTPSARAAHVHSLPATSFSNVLSTFYPNPNDSGAFDATSTSTPAFTQSFSTLDFNPPTSLQTCVNSTGIDENTRPFTNIAQNANGLCTTTVAQGNNQQGQPEQAGVNDLYSFEAEFLAVLTVQQAGQFDLNIYADDGWLLSIGPDSNGNQPSYVAGPLNNAPSNLKGPFSDYPVIGASNVPEGPTQSVVTATFPAAGNYPIELDYTECCGGQLTLVVGDPSSSIVTPTPPPSGTPTPGGTWILPNTSQFTISGDIFHFAAHADRTNPWDPAIAYVDFTVYFLGVNPNVWMTACQANAPTPGTTDQYECDWNLSPSVPNGEVTVSFDVHDVARNANYAPNGTLAGAISRSPQHILLAPFPDGVSMVILNGYNNPPPDQNCLPFGENEHDHCMNQQYAFDFLLPPQSKTTSVDIIAPASGTVAWTSKDASNPPQYCIGLTLDVGNVNMNICHFSSLNGQLQGKHIPQGFFLGVMIDHIHISMDDRYNDKTHPDCTSGADTRTCRAVPFDGYYALEGVNYDAGFVDSSQQHPIPNQYGCASTSDPSCITVTSTNYENGK